MASSRPNSSDELLGRQPSKRGSTLAKALAPEEIRRGDFVEEIVELPSCFWCADSALLPHDEPVRIRFVPSCGGIPLRVARVCLPFVLVKHPCGRICTLDIRRVARLAKRYARRAWKEYKKTKRSGDRGTR
jgi:hypothetical protein